MATSRKIVSLKALKRRLGQHRRRGETIAFTNGCFDVLHYGHVRYLEKAGRNGRVLIVGLNSDRSVRAIKGRRRPINPLRARAGVLAGLACVDYVISFDRDTPEELIRAVRPDVLVKGADWKGKKIAGDDFVRARGGKVEFIRFEPGFSTTRLLAAINKRA